MNKTTAHLPSPQSPAANCSAWNPYITSKSSVVLNSKQCSSFIHQEQRCMTDYRGPKRPRHNSGELDAWVHDLPGPCMPTAHWVEVPGIYCSALNWTSHACSLVPRAWATLGTVDDSSACFCNCRHSAKHQREVDSESWTMNNHVLYRFREYY